MNPSKSVLTASLIALVACSTKAESIGPERASPARPGANGDSTGETSGGTSAAAGRGVSSGTRLRARVRTGSDGSKEGFLGWRDTRLNTDCAALTADDGKSRCVPYSTTSASIVGYFADAACTEPLATRAKGCAAAPTYALDTLGTACPIQYRAYPIRSLTMPTTLYIKSGTSCIATEPLPTDDYYTVEPPVPAIALVELTESIE
jgi:hypothetical protein